MMENIASISNYNEDGYLFLEEFLIKERIMLLYTRESVNSAVKLLSYGISVIVLSRYPEILRGRRRIKEKKIIPRQLINFNLFILRIKDQEVPHIFVNGWWKCALLDEMSRCRAVQSRHLMKSRRFSLKKRIVFEERRRRRRSDDDIRADLVSRRRRCYRGDVSALVLVPFVHRAAAGYFRGFYSGIRFLSRPCVIRPGATKHASVSSRSLEINFHFNH